MAHQPERTDAVAADDGGTVASLFAAASTARANAHVPYSKFPVGAAIRSAEGNVYVGVNVENAAYPEGMCAEASAISAMVTAGDRAIDTIVTVCGGDEAGSPCGGCRQKIREFATADTRVVVCDPTTIGKTYSVNDLLPDSFGPDSLADVGAR